MSILGLGEILLRLSPPDLGTLTATRQLDVHVGGCEANTLATLAGLGVPTRMLSAVPQHALGDLALAALRASGMDTAFIQRLPHRLGTYYCENGFDARPSRVVYDRADSAINYLRQETLDLDTLFAGQRWFYVSGITLALSDAVRELAFFLAAAARERGVKIAFDVNYRSKLWDYDSARPVLARFAQEADLLLAGAADMTGLFGLAPREDSPAALFDSWRQWRDRVGPRYFAATRRLVFSHNHHRYQGCCMAPDGSTGVSREYDLHILERVGGGDAFSAGALYAVLQQQSAQQCADFATACAVLKHSLPGDHALMRAEDILQLASRNSAVMQR
ncbi:MAG: sugar kinase [Paludibacterium sp.]|uniref:sugar kinase n=1 Tax=Paludibacterium sp. TaxID=1917523 RepID=UPI0025D55E76|nr:sugar kinase [Paludibacterium sp.]MBV8048371.1 sugar kinase [Paludibacterium sp.]MBV8647696.1 sugar kinase [Paludibacterium sp.]